MIGTCVYCGHMATDERHRPNGGHTPLIFVDYSDLIDQAEKERSERFAIRHKIEMPRARGPRAKRYDTQQKYGGRVRREEDLVGA